MLVVGKIQILKSLDSIFFSDCVMALRLIEMTLPDGRLQAVEDVISGRNEVLDVRMQPLIGPWKIPVMGAWKQRFSTDQILIKMLVQTAESQKLIDLLVEHFGKEDAFRINIFDVQASIPSLEKDKLESEITEEKKDSQTHISREELHQDLEESAKSDNVYLITIFLSSVVAAIGILNNNVAVIIGAMVIAPLLGPNVALSLATTLGDIKLARSALKANLLGILISIAFAALIGLILPVDPGIKEIASRTNVGLIDIVLALTSGAAGALSFTSAAPGVLIGVAVAVSLLPPLVTFGLLLGAGYESLAIRALLLFLVNFMCVNIAGVVTFLAQGITPRTWWEAEKAKKATFAAIFVWIFMLLALIMIIRSSL